MRACFNPHPARRPDATSRTSNPKCSYTCFNPHPARRPDATLPGRCPGRLIPHPLFQSSSGQKAGCNWAFHDITLSPSLTCFNPHPARRPDATSVSCLVRMELPIMFQSSSGQKAGCNFAGGGTQQRLPANCFNPHPARRPDATSPRDRTSPAMTTFQSSSGQKAGCNISDPIVLRARRSSMFQSSSGQKAGCNCYRWCDQRRNHFGCFNPHPARRPDATQSSAGCDQARIQPIWLGFNPHPARRPDATVFGEASKTPRL